jgi:acetyl-CoA C-acetyltransferase
MTDVVILSYARTPIGRFQGGLASFRAPELGAFAIKAALQRAELDPSVVDECIMGNVLQAGVGQNPARQAARGAGIPDEVGSFTVNKVCGSGMKSIMLAAQAIKAGDAELIVAGGMESMTHAPYAIPKARDGLRLGHGQLVDLLVADGLWDVYNDFHMGNTAELVAQKYEIARGLQDEFAAESHRRAVAAVESGLFDREIVPVEVKDRKGNVTVVARDEGPRADSTVASLSKLRPAFQKDGSVTAGNASSINDGGAAVIVCSAAKAKALGRTPIARIRGYATAGTAPEWVMMAPVGAVRNLWKKTGTDAGSYDLYELNEPFAVASIAVGRELGVTAENTNVRGGAVALGHPIGATGARMVCTLLSALEDLGGRSGVAGLCLGGGNAVAMAFERL